MIKAKDILNTLNLCNNVHNFFVSLGHPYSYLIDCRLNVFRDDNDRWAIAVERLGYNPRAGAILLEVFYYSNCLLSEHDTFGHKTNYDTFYPIDFDYFSSICDDRECLKTDVENIIVRGESIRVSRDKKDYEAAGIFLNEYEPGEISWEETGRMLVLQNRSLFRATDAELYTRLPKDLKKIMALDEWYHRDYLLLHSEVMSDAAILNAYEFNKQFSIEQRMDYETFKLAIRKDEERRGENNRKEINKNRPGAYETWKQIAKVIETGDVNFYKPTLVPNTHWINWEESGSL